MARLVNNHSLLPPSVSRRAVVGGPDPNAAHLPDSHKPQTSLLPSPNTHKAISEFIADRYRLDETVAIRKNDLPFHAGANGRETQLHRLRDRVRGGRNYFEVK